jgi:hypothetical protein
LNNKNHFLSHKFKESSSLPSNNINTGHVKTKWSKENFISFDEIFSFLFSLQLETSWVGNRLESVFIAKP